MKNDYQPWWMQSGQPAAHSAWELAEKIYRQQSMRRSVNMRNMQLFVGTRLIGIFAPDASYYGSMDATTELAYNVVRACVLTASALVARAKPRISILTKGGNHKLRRKGKNLTKYIDGIFYLTKTYPMTKLAFQDSCVFTEGAIKVHRVGDKIVHERVFSDEIGVDDYDALYGDPSVMYHERTIPREIALARTKDTKVRNIINKNPRAGRNQGGRFDSTSDVILIRESWHRASGPEENDGLRILCCEEGLIKMEDWPYDYHPIVPTRWSYRPRGWHGKAAADDIVGIQYSINEKLGVMDESFAKNVPRIGIEAGSQISEGQVTDVPFSFVEFVKTPPVPLIWPAFSPELPQSIENDWRKAFEILGISQFFGTGRKPAGVESAAAQREYQDIMSERLVLVQQEFENMHVEIARRDIDLAKAIAKDHGGKFPINVPMGKGRMERIDWSDVDMDKDAYEMQSFPTNFLPLTPTGRLQFVEDMMGMQLLSRDEAMMLLDYPDLENVTNLINAAIEHTDMVIERILEDGKPYSPTAFDNLPLAIRRATQALLKAENDEYPQKNIDMLQRYIEACQEKQQEAMALQQMQLQAEMMKQQQQQAGAAGPPPAGGLSPGAGITPGPM